MTIDFQTFKYLFLEEELIDKVFLLNNHKVMLDIDLAELYEVSVKYLRFTTTSNKKRIPDGSKFILTRQDIGLLKSQSSRIENIPLKYAFTETGVLALTGQLRSDRAIQTNIKYIGDIVGSKTINIWEILANIDKKD